LFWGLVLPLATIAYAIAANLVRHLARTTLSSKEIEGLVISGLASACVQESKEQVMFLLALLLPVGLAFLATMSLRATGTFGRPEPSNGWLSLLALVSQLCLFGVALHAFNHQATAGHRYRFLEAPSLIVAAVAMGVIVASASTRFDLTGPARAALCKLHHWTRWLPWTLAMFWNVMFASTGVFRLSELPRTAGLFNYHVAFTMGEYAAVLNGRVPLVDFFSQYQNLQAIIAYPVFKLFGFGVGSFTGVMFCLNATAFALLFSVLTKVAKSKWMALVLFVPLVALAYYVEPYDPENGYTSHSFNYFAVGPIRYFGMCLMAWFAVWYLEKPALSRFLVVAPISTLVAINNLDFGVPAAAGVLGCLLLFPLRFAHGNLAKRIVATAGLYVVASAVTLGLCCLSIRVLAGSWPLLSQLTVYQKSFAMVGFFMLPMPEMGLHWIIYLTSISAVIVAIYETFSVNHDEIADNRRIINGSLAYSGIASFGPLAYFVGRSHPWVLEATFLAWAYVLAQLLNRSWQRWREVATHTRAAAARFLIPIPTVGLLGLYALISAAIMEAPNPKLQFFRFTAVFPAKEAPDAALTKLIRKYVNAGDRTVIAYRDAHWLALQADVTNVFPFAHAESLILKDQLNPIMASLTQLPVDRQYLFGAPSSELQERLKAIGYDRLDGVGDFAVWHKEQRVSGAISALARTNDHAPTE
jgi:hypothetical protein